MKHAGLFAGVTLALGLWAGASVAQTVLEPGQRVAGTYDSAKGPNCFILPTTPGSRWRVAVESAGDSFLEVGRGDCTAFVKDREHDDTIPFLDTNSRIDFAAGGGSYIIRVQSWGLPQFVVRAESLPGTATGGMLPAGGVTGPWFQRGWTPESASTAPAENGSALRPRTIFKDCEDVCPELVVLAAGSFTMGSPDTETGRTAGEGPRHAVAFVNPFAIGRYEVTFEEYDACVAARGCSHRPNDQGWGRGRRPVINVSWNDAMAYVAWLSKHTGHRYTLPSEAEWEYAARAGTSTPWHTGRAILTDDANILNTFQKTVAVGAYPPNAFGLHDVHGNVSEWVLDCLDTGYVGVPTDGSAATSGNCAGARMARGGGYSSEPAAARSASRSSGPQTTRYTGAGFRVARAL